MSAALSALDDVRFRAFVDAATPAGTGIGGRTARSTVDGVEVFVKQVPLTDLERQAVHRGSTANVFGLPLYYQYGVGSTGFGAWRELAAQRLTTGWVLAGEASAFPLLHHWRALSAEASPPVPAAELDRSVRYWGGSAPVAERLRQLAAARARLVLVMEHLPYTVHEWLTARVAEGGAVADAAIERVAAGWTAAVADMRTRGMVHFDAHPLNVLTDGEGVYVADFGLALHPSFDLAADERRFLAAHRDFDRYDTARYLVNWLVAGLRPGEDRAAAIRAVMTGDPMSERSERAARIIRRYGPVAERMNDFYAALVNGPKTTPYPVEALARLWTDTAGRPDHR
ncbi:protein kinase family protein [Micromonospora mirobrigensis]|uniref:protein kinase family protein n=1 Tax=Micromonospora mirobrigensis TaxID=262898 RepID=UPI00114D1ED7|nr:protein kinase family protein [Micromonospora mirobrigensis]